MLQDRHETDKFFKYIIQLTIKMDPFLAQIDELLDDEELYQLIRNDLAKRFPLKECNSNRSLKNGNIHQDSGVQTNR